MLLLSASLSFSFYLLPLLDTTTSINAESASQTPPTDTASLPLASPLAGRIIKVPEGDEARRRTRMKEDSIEEEEEEEEEGSAGGEKTREVERQHQWPWLLRS